MKEPKFKQGTPEQAAFLQAIGRLGGKARLAKLTEAERSSISLKGGLATKTKHGREYYSRIGNLPKTRHPKNGGDEHNV